MEPNQVITTIQSWVYIDIVIGASLMARPSIALQENLSAVYGAVWSSYSINVLLGISWMIRSHDCAEYNGIVSFLIANHMVCLHLRLANLLCKYLDAHYAFTGWIWRAVLRDKFKWFVFYILVSVFASTVSHYAAVSRAPNSPFADELNCYIDLGQGVALFTLVLSLTILATAIGVFWFLKHRYLMWETVLVLVLQTVFLVPALSGYFHAYATRDPNDLEWVRFVIVSYNFSCMSIPWLPIVMMKHRDWREGIWEWLGTFGSILEKHSYAPLPAYESHSLSLIGPPGPPTAEIDLGKRIRDIQLLTMDQLRTPPTDLADYDDLFVRSLGRSVTPYVRAAKMISHLTRYLEIVNKRFLWDFYSILLEAYNNAPYGLIVTKQDHLRRLCMTIYEKLESNHRSFCPTKERWTSMVEQGGQGSDLAKLFAAYLLHLIDAVLDGARVEAEASASQPGQAASEQDHRPELQFSIGPDSGSDDTLGPSTESPAP